MTDLWPVVVGGFLSTFVGGGFQWFVQSRTKSGDRQKDQEDHLRAKREALYVDLLRTPPVDAAGRAAWSSEVEARALAFGSNRVSELLKARDAAYEDVQFCATEGGYLAECAQRPPWDQPEPEEELAGLLRVRDEKARQLRAQIRKELGTPEDG